MSWTVSDSEQLYRVSRWSDGYFHIGDNGHLFLSPSQKDNLGGVDIFSVVEEAKKNNIGLPLVLRFHDVLRSRVEQLNETFRRVIDEHGYKGGFMGVYPIKVNQMREVVEEIVDAGKPFKYGLEAGSKTELLSVLAYNTNADSLTILNGNKDDDYIRIALLGVKLKRNVVFVIEKFSELIALIRISKEQGVEPTVGLRMRMMVKGRGKWESSSGARAKFGLGTAEILNAVSLLEREGLKHCISMLHFHIGSQVTDIRAIKEAVRETGQIYAKLVKKNVPIKYVDVGGGLGVDYDGSCTTSESSKNYSLNEYVTDLVNGFQQICDSESVPHPIIVTESGRAITAHHSCIIVPVLGEINPSSSLLNHELQQSQEHNLVHNMRELVDVIDAQNNPQEVYNDASQIKEESIHAFKLGVLSLEEIAELESLYWVLLEKINTMIEDKKFVSNELSEVKSLLSSQYLCNFSVFQSAADSWAIDQVLPVVPIHRLDEKPTKNCSLVDITCDSDGKIDRFIGQKEVERTLPLHRLNDEQYYLGLFLTGAYQDVMGDMHNLFGRLNEIHVLKSHSEPEGFYIEEIVNGSTSKDILSTMQYNTEFMVRRIKKLVEKHVLSEEIRPREGVSLVEFYENCLSSYSYLKD